MKLDQLLSQAFSLPDLAKLRLSVTQQNGQLVLSSPDLAPASAEAWFALSLDGVAGCLDRSRDAAGA